MADTKISALTDGVALAATDRIPLARSPFGSTDNRYILGSAVGRNRTQTDVTYFVRTTGSDVNDGLTVGNAVLTPQRALALAVANQDMLPAASNLVGTFVTIDIGPGSFPEVIYYFQGPPRIYVTFDGDSIATTTVAGFYVSRADIQIQSMTVTSNNSHLVWLDHYGFAYVNNVKVTGTGSNDGFFVVSDSHLNLGTVEFTGTFGFGIAADICSEVQQFDNLTATGATWNTACVLCNSGSIYQGYSQSFGGTATGRRFIAGGGQIFVASGPDAYFPGSAVATTAPILHVGGTYNNYLGLDVFSGDDGVIVDENLNEYLKLASVASAINELTITNAASGNAPAISATGGGTNINVGLTPKGSGGVVSSGYVKTLSTTFGALPTAATAGSGARAFITDCNTATFLATAAAGGSNKVPVVSDGTNWLVG